MNMDNITTGGLRSCFEWIVECAVKETTNVILSFCDVRLLF